MFLCFALLLAISLAQGALTKIDDFESYALGRVDEVTGGNWKGITSNTGFASINTDDADAANQVLRLQQYGSQARGLYCNLSEENSIAEGATRTLYFRFRVSGTGTNHAIGMTSVDAPTTWGDYRAQIVFNAGNLQVRDGGTARNATNFTLQTGTTEPFYNAWMVIDNGSDTYQLYVHQNGNTSATESDRIMVGTQDTFAFRTGTTETLDCFFEFCNTGGETVWVDDVYIMDGETLIHPAAAHEPNPVDGAVDVLSSATLSWKTGLDPVDQEGPNPAITRHYVYFVADAEPNFAGVEPVVIEASGDGGTYAPTLAMDLTCYWRVDESVNNSLPDDPNTIIGAIWSFETLKSIPVIMTDLANERVFAGETAAYTCAFSSLSEPTVVWKKYVDGVNDETLITDGDYSVALESTGTDYVASLNVANAEEGDQGWYYCLLTNKSGQSAVESKHAELVIKKLLAQYEFENNFADSVGTSHGMGSSYPDPNTGGPVFVAGRVAGTQAVSFDGVDDYVDLGLDAYPKAGLGSGLDSATLTCWIMPTKEGIFMSNYNDGGMTGFAFSMTSASEVRINVRGENADNTGAIDIGTQLGKPSTDFNMINEDQWHFAVATWLAGGRIEVYVDGVYVVGANAGLPVNYADWMRAVTLGASRTAADRNVLGTFYGGAMDDFRVYNYFMDKYEVAELYYEATGQSVCIDPYESALDLNQDCVVNLGDLAHLASSWLSCGLYPYCP